MKNLLKFYKYHGTGNDFIIFDNRDGRIAHDRKDWLSGLCHRRFGIGADGVILIENHRQASFSMVYFNSDGLPGSMCGNGGRCAMHFVRKENIFPEAESFFAAGGKHTAFETEYGIKLQMMEARDFRLLSNGDYFINTGSPHFVRFIESGLDTFPVVETGRQIRNSPPFRTEGTNVNFVTLGTNGILSVRTYERGVEDETLSCGTGVTAVAEVYARIQHGVNLPVKVNTRGGQLIVHIQPGSGSSLEGSAEKVFTGFVEYNGEK